MWKYVQRGTRTSTKLLEVYGLTDDQKADKLLELAGIGDWKPSLLCAHIQSLGVSKDALLRHIFLCQLPEDVRVQVAAMDERDLSTLARKAQGRTQGGGGFRGLHVTPLSN